MARITDDVKAGRLATGHAESPHRVAVDHARKAAR